MRTLKEDIGNNAGIKVLNECYKIKEMEAMSRAYSAFSNFAREITSLKFIYDRPMMGISPVPIMMANKDDQISEEDKNKIREKLRSLCLNKVEFLKELIDETFSKKEEKEESGIKVEIERSE